MGRTAEGLKEGLELIKKLRKEFNTNLFIPGSKDGLNVELDKAIHLRDFLLMGELVAYDALSRNDLAEVTSVRSIRPRKVRLSATTRTSSTLDAGSIRTTTRQLLSSSRNLSTTRLSRFRHVTIRINTVDE